MSRSAPSLDDVDKAAMNHEVTFDSVESANEFVTLVAQVALETKRDIEADLQRAITSNFPRRVEALQIIAHSLDTLEMHMKQSRRILNDLRSLRRLLLGERANGTMAVPPKSIRTARARSLPSRPLPPVSPSALSGSAVARDVSTYVRVKRRPLSSGGAAAGRKPGVADAVPWYVRED